MNGAPIGKTCIFRIMRRWDGSLEPGDPGVVDDDIHRRELLGNRTPVRFGGDVEPGECPTNRVCHGMAADPIDVSDNDMCALVGKGRCDGRTDAARRACHEGRLSGQSGHGRSFAFKSETDRRTA